MKTFCGFALIILAIFVLAPTAQAQSMLPSAIAGETATADGADAQSLLDQLAAGELSDADMNALVVQLSDEQIRQIILSVLHERLDEPAVKPESTPFFERFDSKLNLVRQNLASAITALPRIVEVPAFLLESFNVARGPFHIVLVIGAVLAIYLVAYIAERLVGALQQKWMARPPNQARRSQLNMVVSECNNFLSGMVRILVFSVVVFAVFFALWQGHQPTRLFVVSVTTAVIAVRLTLFLAAFAILPGPNGEALFAFEPEAARKIKRQLDQVVYLLAFLAVLGLFLAEFGFDPNGTVALNLTLGTLVMIFLVRLVLTAHRPVAALIRGPGEEPSLLSRGLASSWHLAALAYLGFIYIGAVLSRTAGAGREDGTLVGPGTIRIAIVLAVPCLSAVAKAFADIRKRIRDRSE